jgi:hypothetical protein
MLVLQDSPLTLPALLLMLLLQVPTGSGCQA